jgi:hypothetical protein
MPSKKISIRFFLYISCIIRVIRQLFLSQPALMNSISSPSTTATRTNVFALLIGIDTYVNAPLNGPVSDVRKMTDFLKNLPDDVYLDRMVLTNEQATKTAVVNAVRQHLGKAKPGDTALFYFSGHGTTETADPKIWRDETDGVLSSIVCYNGLSPTGKSQESWDYLLTDKELRFLLNAVTKATAVHTVALFDCCNSGNNTRSLLTLSAQETRERSMATVFPRRPWKSFLFSDSITEQQAAKQPIQQWLPEPIHLQMAACEADEKALEVAGEGVFTKNLLSVLQTSGGALSYESLIDRTRQYMRFGYDQRPRLFAPGSNAETLKGKPFLNRRVNAELPAVLAQFISSKEGWFLNVGALHGLQPGQQVSLLAPDGKALMTTTASEVGLDYAQLQIPPGADIKLTRSLTYRVSVPGPGLVRTPLRIYFASRNGSLAEQASVVSALVAAASGCYLPEEDETKADYALYARNGWYFLTRPNSPAQPDNEYRPLAKPVPLWDKNATMTLATYIRQLSHWTYLKTLQNPTFTGPGVKIVVMPEGGKKDVVPAIGNDPTVPVQMKLRDDVPEQRYKTYGNNVSIEITNNTSQELYCTALYLSYHISSTADPVNLLESNTLIGIGPKQVILIGYKGDKPQRSSVQLSNYGEDVVHDYNWPTVDERFQFIFTTKSANASGILSPTTLSFLQFEELPKPPTLADRLDGGSRGIAPPPAVSDKPLPTWWTQSVNLRWENPLYNKLSRDDVRAMVELGPNTPANDALADCALGLYFTMDTTHPAVPGLRVKPDLQNYWDSQKAGERSFGDFSLWAASRVSQSNRNRQFQESRTTYPDRKRIVATGDSWFQYPFLIRDIVDCLTNTYLVYSLSSTGNTLGDIAPDDVVDAIETADAQFLLFSGGLNDLMDSFTDKYIRNPGGTPKTDPRPYLTPAFFTFLDTMQAKYESLFKTIRSQKPTVNIIAHGYDYIQTINAVSADRNWLAPQLSQKGIVSAALQKALLNLVIDEFNGRLKKAVSNFPGIRYLDLRGAVTSPAYWHDEIHPNDKGFLDLADHFHQLIQTT